MRLGSYFNQNFIALPTICLISHSKARIISLPNSKTIQGENADAVRYGMVVQNMCGFSDGDIARTVNKTIHEVK